MKTVPGQTIEIEGKNFRLFLTRSELQQAVDRLGRKISEDYNCTNLLFVVVLKGSVIFAADLVRAVQLPSELEFIRSRSYYDSMVSRGKAEIDIAGLSLAGKDVIVVEDIVDTGVTISAVIQRLNAFSPNSVRVATLFFKPDAYKGTIAIDYIGFNIPSKFIIGYGLDYAERGRNLPDVFVLDSNEDADN